MGCRNILCAGGSIVAFEDSIDPALLPEPMWISKDTERSWYLASLLDTPMSKAAAVQPASRPVRALDPELAFRSGFTTEVEVLGTAGINRSIEESLATIYALREAGISAWCLTGSYLMPSRRLTGDLIQDVMPVEPVIGLVELAVTYHRSS